jgi:hypothetical protein
VVTEISPGNCILFHSITAGSTISVIPSRTDFGRYNDVLAHPT